jgi:hypothetical protein
LEKKYNFKLFLVLDLSISQFLKYPLTQNLENSLLARWQCTSMEVGLAIE